MDVSSDGRISLEELPRLVDRVRGAVAYVGVETPEGRGNGSGFAITPLPSDPCTGVLVTNVHVVRGCDSCQIVFGDDAESESEARVRAIDPSTDVAILELATATPHALSLRELANVQVGESVLAIGSPYGLSGTVTTGIVSAIGRIGLAPDGTPIDHMIQTDASINPGNSGGPLIGLDGHVIGVNDQARFTSLDGTTGLGFAIPTDMVAEVYREVVETGERTIRRASIGVRLQLISFHGDTKQRWKQRAGARVVDEPATSSPAAAAGIHRGDVLVTFEGERVEGPASMFRLLTRERIGKLCSLTVARGDVAVELAVTPRQREASDT